MAVKLLAFTGSARAGSMNHKLLENAVREAKAQGAEVTEIDINEYNLPIYNGDIEATEGYPDAVMKLKEIFKAHDGFLIASPEYNGTFSGLLKNTIDWVSRPVQGEPALNCFKGKVAGIMSTTPGKMGGIRGIYQLNTLLFILGTLVVPDIALIASYGEAFDDAGNLKDEKDKAAVERLVKRLVTITQATK